MSRVMLRSQTALHWAVVKLRLNSETFSGPTAKKTGEAIGNDLVSP